MSTFVLVHGAWHGRWCWNNVVPLLQAKGHKVLAPDLPGHGDDSTPPESLTLADYVSSIVSVVASVGEPVVLVGHSMAGMVVAAVAEQVPQAVAKLVFLTAFMPASGDSIASLQKSNVGSRLPDFVMRSEDKLTTTVRPEGLVPLFYHDCSPDDIAFAQSRLVREAIAPNRGGVHLTPERFGRIPRLYIECLHDQTIVPSLQKLMINAQPGTQSAKLDSGHSPFFSMPEKLIGLMTGF